jgi:hypothetical protein
MLKAKPLPVARNPGLVVATGIGRGLSILCVLCAAEQCRSSFHREKKVVRPVRQRYEIKVPIKTRSLCIDDINDNGNRGDLNGQKPLTGGIYLPTCFL